jgi:hypothetical protein
MWCYGLFEDDSVMNMLRMIEYRDKRAMDTIAKYYKEQWELEKNDIPDSAETMKDFCGELESSGATFIKRKFKHATLASLIKLLNNDVMPEETSTEWLSYVLNKKDIDHEVDWIKNSRMQMPGATQVFSDRLMKEIYNSMSYCAQYKASVWKGTDSPLKTLLDRWPHDEVVGLVGKDTRDWIRLPFTEMDKTWSLNCETQTLSFTYKGKMREFKYQWPSNTWKYTGNDAGIGLFYPSRLKIFSF